MWWMLRNLLQQGGRVGVDPVSGTGPSSYANLTDTLKARQADLANLATAIQADAEATPDTRKLQADVEALDSLSHGVARFLPQADDPRMMQAKALLEAYKASHSRQDLKKATTLLQGIVQTQQDRLVNSLAILQHPERGSQILQDARQHARDLTAKRDQTGVTLGKAREGAAAQAKTMQDSNWNDMIACFDPRNKDSRITKTMIANSPALRDLIALRNLVRDTRDPAQVQAAIDDLKRKYRATDFPDPALGADVGKYLANLEQVQVAKRGSLADLRAAENQIKDLSVEVEFLQADEEAAGESVRVLGGATTMAESQRIVNQQQALEDKLAADLKGGNWGKVAEAVKPESYDLETLAAVADQGRYPNLTADLDVLQGAIKAQDGHAALAQIEKLRDRYPTCGAVQQILDRVMDREVAMGGLASAKTLHQLQGLVDNRKAAEKERDARVAAKH